jgi:hypothetical protein
MRCRFQAESPDILTIYEVGANGPNGQNSPPQPNSRQNEPSCRWLKGEADTAIKNAAIQGRPCVNCPPAIDGPIGKEKRIPACFDLHP